MSPEERAAVIETARSADGGCGYCVARIMAGLIHLLPDEPWREELPEEASEEMVENYLRIWWR